MWIFFSFCFSIQRNRKHGIFGTSHEWFLFFSECQLWNVQRRISKKIIIIPFYCSIKSIRFMTKSEIEQWNFLWKKKNSQCNISNINRHVNDTTLNGPCCFSKSNFFPPSCNCTFGSQWIQNYGYFWEFPNINASCIRFRTIEISLFRYWNKR